MKEIFFPKRMWRPRPELKRRYEVVIVGGGSHGLATAYYLAKRHGIRDVASSRSRTSARAPRAGTRRSSARTTGRPRARRSTARASACTSASRRARLQPHVLAARAPDARALGPRDDHDAGARRGEQAARDQVERRRPAAHRASSAPSSTSRSAGAYPIVGALYHPPGGIIRHDAVVWGFARAADRLGVEIHPTPRSPASSATATGSPPSRRIAAASSAVRS